MDLNCNQYNCKHQNLTVAFWKVKSFSRQTNTDRVQLSPKVSQTRQILATCRSDKLSYCQILHMNSNLHC
jgi:hypothetical protein